MTQPTRGAERIERRLRCGGWWLRCGGTLTVRRAGSGNRNWGTATPTSFTGTPEFPGGYVTDGRSAWGAPSRYFDRDPSQMIHLQADGPVFTIDIGREVAIGKIRISNWQRNDEATVSIFSADLVRWECSSVCHVSTGCLRCCHAGRPHIC